MTNTLQRSILRILKHGEKTGRQIRDIHGMLTRAACYTNMKMLVATGFVTQRIDTIKRDGQQIKDAYYRLTAYGRSVASKILDAIDTNDNTMHDNTSLPRFSDQRCGGGFRILRKPLDAANHDLSY